MMNDLNLLSLQVESKCMSEAMLQAKNKTKIQKTE